MPWSLGTYARPSGTTQWQQDRDAAIKITAVRHDAHDQDLADGINACLNRAGQNSPTANIAWGGYKITGLGTPTASADAATKAYADAAGSILLASGDQILWRGSSIPTGWTAVAQDNKAIRIVNGTPGSGGATGFTSVFGAGKATGAEGSHTHAAGSLVNGTSSSNLSRGDGLGGILVAMPDHVHTISGSTAAGSSHSHTLSLDLAYYDMRVIQKT